LCSFIEAFGGKRTLTGPGQAGETPSAGSINANHSSREPPAPHGDLLRNRRGESPAVLPVLERDGMEALLRPADIHTDDNGTGLAVSHTDSQGREDSRYHFFFTMAGGIME
jgi:hypothetical protein